MRGQVTHHDVGGSSSGGETLDCESPGPKLCATANADDVVHRHGMAALCDGGPCPNFAARMAAIEKVASVPPHPLVARAYRQMPAGSPKPYVGVVGDCPDGERFLLSYGPMKVDYFSVSGEALGHEEDSSDRGFDVYGDVPACPTRGGRVIEQTLGG